MQGDHSTVAAADQRVRIDWDGRPVDIEVRWVGAEGDRPLLVFLHEGLGSVAMWKNFPCQLCEAVGCRGLIYSRPGYGRSTPRPPNELWDPDFMHRQAEQVLPALLRALGVAAPYWLFGHSDGGSIALLHAARFPDAVAGAVVLAPHILVEQISVDSIAAAREAYEQTDLRGKLARYHDDSDSAFWGWNCIWLDPRFRDWSIENDIATIHCPLLAVQGLDDEYGTLEQIRGIARRLPQTQLLELPDCGHSPHRDQPGAVIAAARALLSGHRGENRSVCAAR
ncbi:putative Alpha/beta hydrolase [Thiomonas arsenitoxydans]|uniref:Alpha/beta hydrolase n=1 Tax=Thiomonas arsenitoxydans (strain DSM 22701 / CIP 110005 / 3As) TaxID=426114 RepID=D6CRH6_THIA3|nr:alpha/beta hydrolase [Thiomonas arsenitoxydans]CAZ87217.1 putative Alpha/beta hydrolase [Thiomonas arsenitoxydans]CQR29199.1 putative Alpha/beta hydrolase [Thiomonas arsenitoxydans]CQR30246.1 putative Alpha/beta hydrolase [Thiomonas arsenitoxydans]CQR41154.1 putative Alpha/beta hydrolase [Thiomonas arsenitoxydans]CQR41223.1 putative Alpha/beta hydrolase [Thiomonas arsenitoxydans]